MNTQQYFSALGLYPLHKRRPLRGKRHPQEFYAKHGSYREIFDASARSLNIEELAKTMTDAGDDVLDTDS